MIINYSLIDSRPQVHDNLDMRADMLECERGNTVKFCTQARGEEMRSMMKAAVISISRMNYRGLGWWTAVMHHHSADLLTPCLSGSPKKTQYQA